MSTELTLYEPTNLEQAMALANTLSKSSLVPKVFFGKPADLLLVIMGGKELGFSAIQSLRSFYVLNGKLALYADAMIAVCVGKQQCKYFRLVESTDKKATYVTQREGSEPVTISYTYEQAKRAGLTGNQTYSKHTEAMLRARCASALARIVYPDLIAGIYDPSELDDSVTVAREQVKAVTVAHGDPTAGSAEASVSQHFDIPRAPVVADDEVAPPAPPLPKGESLFATEAEFDDNSQEHRQHLREQAWEHAKFTSGPLKGQDMGAASIGDLEMYRAKLQKIIDDGRNTLPNLNALDAMDAWLRRKKADAQTWAETPTA